MRNQLLSVLVLLLAVAGSEVARADLTILGTFNPSNAGGLCGLGFDPTSDEVWVYDCSGADVQRYSTAGVFQSAVTRPGEAADDVDVEMAPKDLVLNATPVPAGTLLFVNGESGVAEIYATDKVSGAVVASLSTGFGVSHVVGGAYHRRRDTFFLVQDRVPSAANANRIAEVNRATGAVLNSVAIGTSFDVNFGDLEVCNTTGNLLVVSSIESRIAEYSPVGAFVAYHALPVGVSALSGIGIEDATGDLWVANTTGNVWRLGGGPCSPVAEVPALPGLAPAVLAALLLASAALASRRWVAAR
jgi:hypothetical protein